MSLRPSLVFRICLLMVPLPPPLLFSPSPSRARSPTSLVPSLSPSLPSSVLYFIAELSADQLYKIGSLESVSCELETLFETKGGGKEGLRKKERDNGCKLVSAGVECDIYFDSCIYIWYSTQVQEPSPHIAEDMPHFGRNACSRYSSHFLSLSFSSYITFLTRF